MDFKLMLSTFVAVFLAELGDKTQLATLSLASQPGSAKSVFLGSATALVCSSALAVLAGEWVAKFIPPIWIRRAAATVFLVLGAIMLSGTFRSET